MRLPFYQIDAFTSGPFTGNPAAVMPLAEFLPDNLMLAIAAENNLSETAFLVRRGPHYQVRWFTPRVEVELCGHATLAAAFALWTFEGETRPVLKFDSQSGPLSVARESELLVLDFPKLEMTLPLDCLAVGAALGLEAPPLAALGRASRYLLEIESPATLRSLAPDMTALAAAAPAAVVYVTARGEDEDFVCRVFAPGKGIDEDPVTGSAYTALVPYWAPKLGKNRLFARQLSSRGGEVWGEMQGERVLIKGRARGVITGEFEVQV